MVGRGGHTPAFLETQRPVGTGVQATDQPPRNRAKGTDEPKVKDEPCVVCPSLGHL